MTYEKIVEFIISKIKMPRLHLPLLKLLISTFLLCTIAPFTYAVTYKWEDKNGVHFTDNASNIPEKYRDKVSEQTKSETISRLPQDVTVPPQQTRAVTPQVNQVDANKINIERQRQLQEVIKQQRASAADQSKKTRQGTTQSLFKFIFFCLITGSVIHVIKNNKAVQKQSKLNSRSRNIVTFETPYATANSDLKESANYVIPSVMTSLPPPVEWDESILNIIEWRRFEIVCVEFFKMKGYSAQETRVGADGGVDINLYMECLETPVAIVQCKAWNTYKVGVKPIRELFGVMAADRIEEGFFVTSGEFSREAQEFAEGKRLNLFSGHMLLNEIKKLPNDKQQILLNVALEGDYTTPSCPQCDVKMVIREVKTGRNAGSQFWGCVHYPRCRQTFKFKDIEEI